MIASPASGLKRKSGENRSLIGLIGADRPTYPTSFGFLAREQEPRVGRWSADESEGEVIGVLPVHLASQHAVLSILGRKGQESVNEG
jgi:hypothetical protein